MEPSMDEILERATYYYKYDIYKLNDILRKLRAPYEICWRDVKDSIDYGPKYPTMNALTRPDIILLILQLTQPKYEAIKALPKDELPLLVNENLEYPDIIALFNSRLKND